MGNSVERSLMLSSHAYQPPRFVGLDDYRHIHTDPGGINYTQCALTESYQPVAQTGLLTDTAFSFDIYPTLLRDIDHTDPRTASEFRRGLRINGIGTPILHILLPDLNVRDKKIVIESGKRVFKKETGGIQPLWVWTPEGAIDYQTLESLDNAGYQGFICGPNQIRRLDGGNSQNQMLRIQLSHNRSIVALVFDKQLSDAFAFGDKSNADRFAHSHIAHALYNNSPAGLIAAHLDFETWGHYGDKKGHLFLDYLLHHTLREQLLQVNGNKEHIKLTSINSLKLTPQQIVRLPEARIYERSSWSCMCGDLRRWHGGCNCGGGYNHWKKSFYQTFQFLNAEMGRIVEKNYGPDYFQDITTNFLDLLYNPGRGKFATPTHALLSAKTAALAALTSCGTFFGDPHTSGRINLLWAETAIAYLSLAGLQRTAHNLRQNYHQRLAQIPDPTRPNQPPLLLTLEEMFNERKNTYRRR